MKRPPNRGWNNLFQTVMGTTCPQSAKRIAITAAACLILTPSSPAIIDTNENGLSDLWEKQHNDDELFPETFDTQADPDQDGWTNADEAAAGTDPFDPNPPGGFLRPEILHTPAVIGEENGQPVIITPEAVTVSWPTLVGKQYTLQLSADLSASGWVSVSPFVGDGDVHEFNFLTATAASHFYRVAVTDTDSDGDELTDAEENELGTNPASTDTDGDGLNDLNEIAIGTNPNNSDTDGDGMNDRWEADHGLDPNDDGSTNPDNGAAGDPDDDGIPNQYDSTPLVADEFVAVIHTEGRYYVTYHASVQQVEKRVSLDRLMNASPVAIVDYADGLGTVEIAEVSIEASEPVLEEKKFVLSNLLDLDYPSIFEEDYSVEVRPSLLLKIEVGQTQSNSLPVKAGVENLETLPPNMHKAAYLDHMVLEWQPIEGWNNVEDHVDPWEEVVNGKRIFPCVEDPSKSEIRHKLRLVVKASPLLVGKPVHVKSFDIDDSTSEGFDQDLNTGAPCIDANGKAGGDNREDYLETELHGMFWDGSAWGTNTENGTLDNDGKAEFQMRVGMQPGDNYKAAASVFDASMYSYTQHADATSPHYIGPDRIADGDAPSTAMLTVWRKLWVENDSMDEIPRDGYGYLRNDLSSDIASPSIQGKTLDTAGTNTIFLIDPINDGSSFVSLENGRIIVQSAEHPVTGSGFLNGYHAASVAGDYTNVPLGSEYRLYDDDSFGINAAPLPRTSIVDNEFQGVYKTAFIDIEDGHTWNTNKLIPFYLSHPPVVGNIVNRSYGALDDALDAALEGGENKWCASCVVAYQPGSNDNDPNSEDDTITGATVGDTAQFAGKARISVIYSEVIRDALDQQYRDDGHNVGNSEYELRLRLTAAHEIGHQPIYVLGEAHHDEQGLMAATGHNALGSSATPFTAESVNRFRSVHKWRQKEWNE